MNSTPPIYTHQNRLRGLDGLRGIAALAVFGVHYNQIVDVDVQLGAIDFYLLLVNGEYGVALFFILSGLLLSQPFWKSIINGASWPDIKTFYLRRLARILPAYYLALTLLILLSGYWRFPQAWSDILLHYGFVFNYAEFSILSINAPFWTLAVEVQFYCLLPFLFLLLRNRSLRTGMIILIILSFTAYGLHYWLLTSVKKLILWPGSTNLTWVRPYGAVLTQSLLAHLPHFFIGIICGGWLLHQRTTQPKIFDVGQLRYDFIFWLTSLLVFLLLATELGENIQIPYGRYGLPLVPILLGIIIVSTALSRNTRKLLDSRPLRALGAISYSVYIYHLPVLQLVDHRMTMSSFDAREHWLMLAIISLLLSLLAATISYLLVERPALKWIKHKTSDKIKPTRNA